MYTHMITTPYRYGHNMPPTRFRTSRYPRFKSERARTSVCAKRTRTFIKMNLRTGRLKKTLTFLLISLIFNSRIKNFISLTVLESRWSRNRFAGFRYAIWLLHETRTLISDKYFASMDSKYVVSIAIMRCWYGYCNIERKREREKKSTTEYPKSGEAATSKRRDTCQISIAHYTVCTSRFKNNVILLTPVPRSSRAS